MTISEKQS